MVQVFIGGPLYENCYIFQDDTTGDAVVIDPGFWNRKLDAAIRKIGVGKFKGIFLTHGHFDHIGGTAKLKKILGVPVYFPIKEKSFILDEKLNKSDMLPFGKKMEPFEPDVWLSEGDKFRVGETEFYVMETPGHTVGSCCFIGDRVIFSGDTLFSGSAGRTDFPTGDTEALLASLDRLKHLEGDYIVYPGHESSTSLAVERELNPYLVL